ncbi:MAG: prepilin-type N-terminal cleavage/methylation domain-containing protein [Candidatus Saccharibacteria bacterium]
MISKDIKGIKKDSGFTIVELLVVIVVIGILAAITIISYTGVTARAKTSQSQSNAQSAQTVAEAYNADTGSYPPTAAAFSSTVVNGINLTTKLPANMVIVPGVGGTAGAFTGSPASLTTLWGTTISSANFTKTVTWACSPTCTNPTGGRVTYYDFSAGAQSTNIVYVGTASATTDFAAPAN